MSRRQNGIGLYFDEQGRINERADLDHGACWTDISEEFAMCFAYRFPPADVRNENPSTDYVLQAAAKLGKRFGDSSNGFTSLLGDVIASNRPAVRERGSRSGHSNPSSCPHGAGVANYRTPRRTCRHKRDVVHLASLASKMFTCEKSRRSH
jgi:hypothetical protein